MTDTSAKVYMICGKLCCGKTAYSQKLMKEKKAVILSVDEIMLSLYDHQLGDKHEEISHKVQRLLYDKSLEIVRSGISVILDWGFWRREDRQLAKSFYSAHDVPYEFHYICISDELWHLNIQNRNKAVQNNETQAYFVDENLSKKCQALFDAPEDGEIDVFIDRNIPLPAGIVKAVSGQSYTLDSVGMSGSTVIIFENCVLKICQDTPSVRREADIMRWLNGKIPVPKIICHVFENGKSYLLMSRVEGKMSCDKSYIENPNELLRLLADALRMLWSVDVSECPFTRQLEEELDEAQKRIESGLVEVDKVEPETFGEGGFADPSALLEWLRANKPECGRVLSHGDFCLPNIFLKDGNISGFIDLGDCGVGDKWRDISLCCRSLKHNFDGSFGGKVYTDFRPEMLFEALGIQPDWDRLRYWLLLDELF